jgi:hypothetical protein
VALQEAADNFLAFSNEYSLLAVFGLAPHSAVRLKIRQIQGIDVLETKHAVKPAVVDEIEIRNPKQDCHKKAQEAQERREFSP